MDNSSMNDVGELMYINATLTSFCKSTKLDYSIDHDEESDDLGTLAAPPPSPQESSPLDAMFTEKLTCSLQRLSPEPDIYNNPSDHARALDRLLRRTISQQQQLLSSTKKRTPSTIKKDKHKRTRSTEESWVACAWRQKLEGIAEAADKMDQLKRAANEDHVKAIIHDLRDMGL
ncbi:hypothetical protein DFQ28_001704 [Apophysomyces sp. BC1034]|nr:hypothetical protein DFQ30_006014 [Apophysomyces sp. BC1015]KAG0180106.1 hypothetical protein DFQ29_001208 [Apophysomyces sp. BC1021]KAG0190676.1 hypothetical protein DFQ28_001704 [Apophysomyces sp. BC1034]